MASLLANLRRFTFVTTINLPQEKIDRIYKMDREDFRKSFLRACRKGKKEKVFNLYILRKGDVDLCLLHDGLIEAKETGQIDVLKFLLEKIKKY